MKPIFLIGYMGSGKTTFGKNLAKNAGLHFIDTDVYIEQREGMSIKQLFAERGEAAFRAIETEVLQELSNREDVVIATGGGMPCFGQNMEIMNRNGLTIYLEVSVDCLTDRLEKASAKRPLLAGKSRDEIHDFITVAIQQRLPYYEQAQCRVDASSNAIDDLLLTVARGMA